MHKIVINIASFIIYHCILIGKKLMDRAQVVAKVGLSKSQRAAKKLRSLRIPVTLRSLSELSLCMDCDTLDHHPSMDSNANSCKCYRNGCACTGSCGCSSLCMCPSCKTVMKSSNNGRCTCGGADICIIHH